MARSSPASTIAASLAIGRPRDREGAAPSEGERRGRIDIAEGMAPGQPAAQRQVHALQREVGRGAQAQRGIAEAGVVAAGGLCCCAASLAEFIDA